MKLVTYNVNGLRPRISQHGSLLKLLNSFDADIICFQETKLSKGDLTADMIMAEGYESFFSCTSTSGFGRTGYSGVATFCRVKSAFSSKEVALPVEAEEGFTGLLEQPRTSSKSMGNDLLLDLSCKIDCLDGLTKEELLKVDGEGRCVITDHGHFVLFNIYGPRADHDDTERVHFKLTFFNLLQKRWEAFLSQGKRIFVVGDLNIAPYAIDRCEADPKFEENQFRKWLRSKLIESGGPFFDVFRSKHPDRIGAYTCWSQQTGAEEFNYGSRIDHILVAGPCLHNDNTMQDHSIMNCHVTGCDIMTQFKRWKPENVPRWKGGRSTKLEGSDHVPVYVTLREFPDLPEHNTPSLAARYVPRIRGSQQTIVTLLSKRQEAAKIKNHGLPLLSDENVTMKSCNDSIGTSLDLCTLSCSPSIAIHPTSSQQCGDISPSIDQHSSGVANVGRMEIFKLGNGKTKPLNPNYMKTNKRAKLGDNNSQRTLKSYFNRKTNFSVPRDCASSDISQDHEGNSPADDNGASTAAREPQSLYGERLGHDENINFEKNDSDSSPSTRLQSDVNVCSSSQSDKYSAALFEWQRIQKLMDNHKKVPLCKGHKEPCVTRVVKKPGPNLGRKFYVCGRAEGPSSNPETNCEFFVWATSRSGEKRK